MTVVLFICRFEPSCGIPVCSVRQDSTAVSTISQPAPSEPQLDVYRDQQEVPAAHVTGCRVTAAHDGCMLANNPSVSAWPEHFMCTDGKLVLHRSKAPLPGLPREQAQGESPHPAEGGASRRVTEDKDEAMNNTQRGVPLSPSQTSNMTFDPSAEYRHTAEESPEHHSIKDEAAPSYQNSEPRPPSEQSVHCLPTFTSQRPVDLSVAPSTQAQPDSWNVHSSSERQHRYVSGGAGISLRIQ